MRTVFMGTPGVVIPVLAAVMEMEHHIVGVYAQPDKPAGRGRRLEAPLIKGYAQEHSLPVFQPQSLRESQALQQIAGLKPELIVVAAYGKILPQEVLSLCPSGCINIHPSLLPRHRGPSPVATAIFQGDAVTGVTLIRMDVGMDTGPILAQREEPLHPTDTTLQLTERLFRSGAALLKEILPQWLAGELVPQPQREAEATYTRMIKKEDGQLEWHLTAQELERYVRAFTPWPGSYTHWQGQLLKVLRAYPLEATPGEEPGRVVFLGKEETPMGVVTGQGILALALVQVEGRKPLSGEEFLRGHGTILGSKLPS